MNQKWEINRVSTSERIFNKINPRWETGESFHPPPTIDTN